MWGYPKVPASVREGLNVESGLNDGICVPVLLMFLALLVEQQTLSPLSLAFELVMEELGIGAFIGISLTLIAWRLQRYCANILITWEDAQDFGVNVAHGNGFEDQL